jgi:hypothetical protein
LAPQARAETFSVQSITPQTPNLGNVVSAASGDTVFTVSPSSGEVTRASGAGVRLTTGSTRALVTIACGDERQCEDGRIRVRIGSIGAPTGRARALTNFRVDEGSASIVGRPQGTNPIDFVIGPIGRNRFKTFYVGADMGIAGDDSGLGAGLATAGFYVFVARNPQTPTAGSISGRAAATVYRPISISKQSDLSFGAIARPTSGTGTVTINALSGARTLSGGLTGLDAPTPTRALFKVQGEGGGVFCVNTPSSMVMRNAASATLVVSLTSSASERQTLGSTLGSSGTLALGVGGSLSVSNATPPGAYTGVFSVTVAYN